MKREKCLHCGQSMPPTEEQKKKRIKIKRGTIMSSEYHLGAFAWFDKEEGEGSVVGQSYKEKTEEEMREIIKGDKADKADKADEVDEVLDREYWAIELSAILVAREYGESYSKEKLCWIWHKTSLKKLIDKAESLLNGDE